jgi:hypothetical protein
MMPGETAFTRMPREAYSMASDFVAEARPPLVSEGKTDGELPQGAWSSTAILDGYEVDAHWIVRHVVHDATHHLGDVIALRAAL